VPGPCPTLPRDDSWACRGFVTDLLVRCAHGEDAALAPLFDLFHPLVGSLAVAHAPDHEVTDVVLRAFVRVWQRAGMFRPETHDAVSWVLREVAAAVAEHTPGSVARPARAARPAGDEQRSGVARRPRPLSAAPVFAGPV
jgi:hypothetical protein